MMLGSGTVLDAITQPRASVFRTLHLRLPSPFTFDVVQSAVMETITSRYTTPLLRQTSRVASTRSPRLSSPPGLARSFEGTSFVDVAGVEGYHRVLYHISYYNTACYNPCCRVSIGFALFFPFSAMRQPTMTDTCVFVFYHARDQGGNPCVPTTCASAFFPLHMYIFFLGFLCRPCLSKIRCTDLIGDFHDLHVSLVRTLPRGTG